MKINPRAISSFLLMALFALLGACGGGGGGSGSTSTTVAPVTPVATAAVINLGATPTTVAADNSTTTTITATVADASNAAVSGVTVTFSADTGFLSASSVVSDATGKATVTFSSGSSNPTTRTATVTASASGKSTQLPIRISGSTVTLASSASSLVVGGGPATLTVTVKSASAAVLSGQTVTLTPSGTGTVTLGAATGVTDSTGTFTTTVTPGTSGTVTLTVASVGETRTVAYTVSGVSVAFQITAPATDPTAGSIGVPVTVSATAPSPTTSVTFVATLGTWDATGSSTVTKPVVGGVVSANLVSAVSGVSNVQVYDPARTNLTATRNISYTAAATAARRITLQASPSVLAPSIGGTTGVATLIASVTDVSGNPVGGAAVSYSIINPTGGGETVLPAVGITSSVATSTVALGQTQSTFTSGSLPSSAGGVQIRATVVGTSIATNTSPSGSDAAVVIGGTAGSVTIGRATTAAVDSSGTLYVLPMSVLVADANGNPVTNTTVSLSAWPIAFNANGTACSPLPANDYYNEDDVSATPSFFENLSLDAGEDGVRKHYPDGTVASGGTVDGKLTPPNSAAGTLPSTVVTNASGVASFSLTYTKSNSLWIIDRIRARTLVQGTETLGQVIFRLPALVSDIGPPCLIPDSPYQF